MGIIVLLIGLLFSFFVAIEFVEYFSRLPEVSLREEALKHANIGFDATSLDGDSPLVVQDSSTTSKQPAKISGRDVPAFFSGGSFMSRYCWPIGITTGILLTIILLLFARSLLAYNNLYRRFQRFLWWCAGARIDFLEQSPSDHAKYFGIGGTVLFTALMATFAGGYAFFTAFDNLLLSMLFGLFWGALIFNLDRYIVSSTGKGDGTAKITREEFTSALPRLILAVLIAFVVSTPLELKVFEKEIRIEIQKIIDEKRQDLARGQDYNLVEIQRIKDEISRLNTVLEESKNGISDDPRVDLGNERIDDLNNEISPLNNRLNRLEKEKNSLQSEIREIERALENMGINNPSRIDLESRKRRREKSMEDNSRNAGQVEKEIARLRGQINKEESDISTVKNENAQNYGARLAQTRNEIERLEQQLFNIQQTRRGEIQRYEEVARQYTGLMAQLDALDRLTVRPVYKEKIEEEIAGYPVQGAEGAQIDSAQESGIDTIGALANSPRRTHYIQSGTEWTPIFYAKWLITLLFICIEIAPILFKMMTESGTYDDLLEAERQESEARRIKRISDLNMEINNDIKINSQKHQDKLDLEVKANKEILEVIANAQNDIAKFAIEDWRGKQIEEVRTNPEAFIKSSILQNGTPQKND